MTPQRLSQLALLELAAGDPASPWLTMEVEAGVAQPQALQDLGLSVARDPRRFGLLQQEYIVTLNSGIGNLVTTLGNLTGITDIIWEAVSWGRVQDENFNRLHYIPTRHEFEATVLRGLLYYTIDGGGIFTRSGNTSNYQSDKLDVIGPLSIIASYYPSVGNLSTLPLELESDSVRFLARALAMKYQVGETAKAA